MKYFLSSPLAGHKSYAMSMIPPSHFTIIKYKAALQASGLMPAK